MIKKAEEYGCGREWGWSGRKDIFTVSVARLGPAAQHVMLAPPERWVTVPKPGLEAIPRGLRAVITLSNSSPSSVGPTTLSHLWPFPWPPSSNDVSHRHCENWALSEQMPSNQNTLLMNSPPLPYICSSAVHLPWGKLVKPLVLDPRSTGLWNIWGIISFKSLGHTLNSPLIMWNSVQYHVWACVYFSEEKVYNFHCIL